MFLSSRQHLLPLHLGSNVNRKQLHKNKLISSVGLADTLPFKAWSSPPSFRPACGPCSGTDLPISEQRSPWKEVSHGLWQEDKGFGGHDSPEESCRWTEKPRTWTTGCQRLFIACIFWGCATPVLRSPDGPHAGWWVCRADLQPAH